MKRWKNLGLRSVDKVIENVFLFNFVDARSQKKVLEGGPYTFNEHPLLLKAWQPLMSFDLCNVQNVPVWVQLPLPWELWTNDMLSKIGSILGTPLFTDVCTITKEKLWVCSFID